ncbi:MAG: tetratricopeptide repeat protein [Pseudanabaenaceae cyanobacterium SKYGB_i_bin29]|nr:tetratricopeptide repeat protein [Pseudanabaenaceae cyanobacterium SKYG29]MDW8420536.1 tetratricopeptide repeat protein [Pseudanabaenaceae cyanobacterium SKYGB_i_bin29]
MNLTKIEQAWVAWQAGNTTEAISICQEIITRNPQAANACYLLAKCYRQLGQVKEARIHYQKCLEFYPQRRDIKQELDELEEEEEDDIDHWQIANSLVQQKHYEQAIYHYEKLRHQPEYTWDAHFNLALIYQHLGQIEKAIELYRTAIQIQPDRVNSYINLGVLLKQQGRYPEAIDIYQRAITLSPHAGLYSNLANIYLLLDELEKGIECCDKAIALDPDLPHSYDIKGACLEQQGKLEAAIGNYRLAIDKKPDFANAHFNLAHALLSLGQWEEGWQEYLWRFKRGNIQIPAFTQPWWDGSFLEGQKILLWSEQGFGDTLQFVRYVWYVRERGGKVILSCPPSLTRLLGLVEGVEQVVSEGEALPAFAVHAPLLDLPRLCQTTLENVPTVVPYLRSPKQKKLPLRDITGDKLKIGIVWQSVNANDLSAQKLRRHKSVDLDHFLTLLDDRYQFFSLQVGVDDILLPPNIVDLAPLMVDFADTADFIEQLDLVITIDTAVAHLAGGLGKPVWVLLPYACDWRWLQGREDSPWYPTMRLFRQEAPNNWAEVFARVKLALSHFSPISLPDKEAIFQQGNIFFHHNQPEKAVSCYQQAIYLNYPTIHPYFNIGVVKRSQSLPEQACVYFDLVINKQPNYAPAYLTLAKAYIDREMLDDAYRSIQQYLQFMPDAAEGYHTLGLIYFRQGKNKEAIENYRIAINKNPQDALTHYNLAISLLLEGNYKEGWQEYEWRMNAQDAVIKLQQPRWDGSDLANKTILLWSEGGFGDTIQFLRYIPFLQQQGATIILACQQQLVKLLQQELPYARVIPIESKVSHYQFDYHLPLMSLPHVLQLEYIPTPIPYISRYPQQKRTPQKIGIVWASGYRSTPNLYRLYKQKSCPIAYFMQLLDIPHIWLYSFQVGRDAKDIQPFLQDRVIDLSDRLQDFTDTVKLLKEMDLLITVDTGIAHLAGAMGMPVWLLLPFAADWRWHKDRSDSDWYPTMRLFRQKQINDWQSVIDVVKAELAKFYQGNIDTAEELLRAGKEAYRAGELDRARALFEQTIVHNPQCGKAYFNLGVIHKKSNRWDEALRCYQRALELGEDPATIYFHVGNLYLAQRELDRAAEAYKLSLDANPNFADSYVNLMEIASRRQEYDLATAYCQKLLELQHNSARFYNNWAILLAKQNQYELAKAKAKQALAIDPNFANAYATLGHIAHIEDDLVLAQVYYEKSLHLHPGYAPTYALLGNLMMEYNNYDRAEELYNRAIELDYSFPHAHYAKSAILLARGDFLNGWREYEWRWQHANIKLPNFPFPPWQGEDLTNKSILLHGEQGFGDKLQFIRFVSVLQQLGANVFYLCPPPLARLFSTIPNLAIVEDSTPIDQLPPLDYFIPLLSIPHVLQLTIDRIPKQVPYFYPEFQQLGDIQERQGLKVGFVWASGRHSIELGEFSYQQKSCPLDYFLQLLSLPNLHLFSLQIDESASELEPHLTHPSLVDCRPLIRDFYDTAVIMQQLDLIITVDTAVAHLAGALAKPVWVLLPFASDWRWLIDRADSPWYPTMKLFRQPQRGDWQSVWQLILAEMRNQIYTL